MVKKNFSKKTIYSASKFLKFSAIDKYSYNFKWYGRPIIQYPQDIVALQEIIWSVKPDLIIETGIAHGGSLIFSASTLAVLDLIEASNKYKKFDPRKTKRKVIGVDIDIRKHNKKAIKKHPFYYMIDLIEGSSTDSSIVNKIKKISKKFSRILVILDSNHTTEHVLSELNLYSSLVSKGSYCIVFDTLVGDFPKNIYEDRPWGPNNNPKIAVKKFLSQNNKFIIDKDIYNRYLITVSKDGYLKKIK
jgi:cephalosporin hydroxylase